MRRVRPADVEQARVERAGLGCFEKPGHVVGVSRRLLAGHEPGAHPGRAGAKRQDRGEAPPIRDAAGGDHGGRPDGVDDGRHERHGRHVAPDVAAGLPALRHDHVHARRDGFLRLCRAAHGQQRERSRGVHGAQVRRGIAPEERDHPDARVQRRRQPLVLRLVDDQVDSERPGGQGLRRPHRLANLVRRHPGLGDHPKAAGIRHGRRESRVR